ncbi:DNA polymerase/3'-5' exonuclease PolX [Salinicoccus kekensis]|uniref:DNA-directed DNA polymerase n=1 Tax=Salinicoccus kekensis TaxID=714307 RepID=A0A285UB88_9STAP|nr:DNA polymerase/3'-5' exonuclease PolX [Salinicoccus kekensis]SOC39069.1 DNA polymerase (family 10) [Salinicoccus kekensis]
MTKKDIIRLLENIATYMELSLENPFKVSAYRKAAQSLETDPRSLSEIDKFIDIKGIGKGVNEVIVEYVEKGESTVFKELQESVPAGLVQMTKIPTLGPKKIAKIYKELGIDTLEGLKNACENEEISALSGFGKKTEENISKAIDDILIRPERYAINQILKFREIIESHLSESEHVERFDVAGSARRMKETSRDIDYIVISKDPQAFTEEITEADFVKETVVSGDKKLSIIIEDDLQEINVDFRFVTEAEYYSTLHHFTGSKEHNVKMRQIAKKRDEKISEYGVEKDGETVTFDSEADFYNHFGLEYIPPAMRETGEETELDVGDIVTLEDIKGDIHMHTVYSDGAFSIREMVEACIEKGYGYIVITDHSKSLRVANGLDEKRLIAQLEEIRAINEEYDEIDVYSGTEMDILKDGTLDYSDDILKELDYVIAAIHSSFQQTEEEIMHRLESACRNPYVRHIAHPTGRLIGRREGYPIDMDRLISLAAETGTALEVNANPMRLDLSAEAIRHKDVMLSVNTDAHHTDHLDFMKYGVATLQKGLIRKDQVINTMTREDFREFINKQK